MTKLHRDAATRESLCSQSSRGHISVKLGEVIESG